jgi:hypothetical protein
METPKAPSDLDATSIESLPEAPVAEVDADAVKGGTRRRVTGGDDDLEDLEVER